MVKPERKTGEVQVCDPFITWDLSLHFKSSFTILGVIIYIGLTDGSTTVYKIHSVSSLQLAGCIGFNSCTLYCDISYTYICTLYTVYVIVLFNCRHCLYYISTLESYRWCLQSLYCASMFPLDTQLWCMMQKAWLVRYWVGILCKEQVFRVSVTPLNATDVSIVINGYMRTLPSR